MNDSELCLLCILTLAPGATTCAVCPMGRIDHDSSPNTSCASCHRGSYARAGTTACIACKPGFIDADASANTPCVSCSASTYSGVGQTVCQGCGAGTMLNSTKSGCARCPRGTQSADRRKPHVPVAAQCDIVIVWPLPFRVSLAAVASNGRCHVTVRSCIIVS